MATSQSLERLFVKLVCSLPSYFWSEACHLISGMQLAILFLVCSLPSYIWYAACHLISGLQFAILFLVWLNIRFRDEHPLHIILYSQAIAISVLFQF